jgi:hypothetical protein
MTNYVKSTSFASKDALATGNPLKIVKGTEIDTEFNNIAVSSATKADLLSPVLAGTPTSPTAAQGTSNTQIATTAFVQNEKNSPTFSGTTSVGVLSFNAAGWSLVETGGVLYFKYNGTSMAKLDASGNLTVKANVTAYGTI